MAMQFFVRGCINDVWKRAFKEEQKTVLEIKIEGTKGKQFHDLVVETFLYEYENTRSVKLPDGYSFPEKPTLMQKFIAYKISTRSSGTGAGKTLSAVLSSRITSSKMTVT